MSGFLMREMDRPLLNRRRLGVVSGMVAAMVLALALWQFDEPAAAAQAHAAAKKVLCPWPALPAGAPTRHSRHVMYMFTTA